MTVAVLVGIGISRNSYDFGVRISVDTGRAICGIGLGKPARLTGGRRSGVLQAGQVALQPGLAFFDLHKAIVQGVDALVSVLLTPQNQGGQSDADRQDSTDYAEELEHFYPPCKYANARPSASAVSCAMSVNRSSWLGRRNRKTTSLTALPVARSTARA